MKIILMLIIVVGAVVWIFKFMNSNKARESTKAYEDSIKLNDDYRYKPESKGVGYYDEVTFSKPDSIKIERHFEDGLIKCCSTQINTSTRGANAWTTKDIQLALEKKGVTELLEKGGAVVQMQKTIDGEGSQQGFTLSWQGKTIKILPPKSKEVADIRASEDIVEMVYVLSKVYQQQLMHIDCFSRLE